MTPARSLLLALSIAAALPAQTLQRSIEIWSEHPIAIEIEWLTIDDAGTQTVTARRKTAVGPPVPLEFTHGNDRYVRFLYQGASPRTYSTAELIAAKKLHVPDVLPGGELLLFVPPMTVRAKELLIEGPRVKTIALDSSAHASLPGMPGGNYRVVPMYEGGIKGEAKSFTVKTAETTLALMPAEEVGAVRVFGEPGSCGLATELVIHRLVNGPSSRTVAASSREPRCDMTFGGLKPGTYEALYNRQTSTIRGKEFELTAQSVATAEIGGPRVTVSGRVTLNGKPMSDMRISFVPRRSTPGRPMPSAMTDAAGFYSTAMEEPGPYSVRIMHIRGVMAGTKEATLAEGGNQFDWAITGGTINVAVRGAGPDTDVTVTLKSGARALGASGAHWMQPHAFGALPYGEWQITATAGSRPAPVQQVKRVVISAASPEITVTFDFSKR